MADRFISEEVAIAHSHGVVTAARPENLTLKPVGAGPYVAEQMIRMKMPTERADAVVKMNGFLKAEIAKSPIAGRPINNLGDIGKLTQEIVDKKLVLAGQDQINAGNLMLLRFDTLDGVAVATLAGLSADPDTTQLIKGKTGSDVEKALGIKDEMVGVGDAVVDSAIFDTKIRKLLGRLQSSATAGGLDLAELSKVYEILDGLNMDEKVDEAEANMVLTYLNVVIGGEKEEIRMVENVRLQAEQQRNAAFDAQQQLAERNLELGEQAELTTWTNWTSAIFNKGEQTAVPGAIWTLRAPEYYNGTGAEWNGFLAEVTAMSNLTFKRKIGIAGARDMGKAYFDPGFPVVTEKGFADLYLDPRSGFKRSLETIVQDLFVETITEETADGKLVVRKITQAEIDAGVKGQFVMKNGVVGVPANEQEGAKLLAGMGEGGRRAYLLRLAELQDGGITNDENFAAMQASLAMDFLETAFVFDAGDHKRKCTFTIEGVRTTERPSYKFGDKTAGGEVFSVNWNNFYLERYGDEVEAGLVTARAAAGAAWDETMERDEKNRLVVEMARKNALLPPVLCGSILDMDMVVGQDPATGEDIKMSLGRLLEAGIDVPVHPDSMEDMLFPTKKWFENAATFWGYVSSAEKLDYKGDTATITKALAEFGKNLNNSYGDLKSRGMVDVRDLIAAIGGACGMYSSDPPVLMVPVDNVLMTYDFVGETLLNNMPNLLESEKQAVVDFFGFKSKIALAVPTLYAASRDKGLPAKDRKFYKDVMQNRGGPKEKGRRKFFGG